MRVFATQGVFWQSCAYRALRACGLSEVRPFKVLLRVEPVSVRSELTGEEEAGFFFTRIVFAPTAVEAERVVLQYARHVAVAAAGAGATDTTRYVIEEMTSLDGWVWWQPRGYSFFALKEDAEDSPN